MIAQIENAFHRYLFQSCSPATCVLVRSAYAALLIVYVGIWMLDGSQWFSNDGVLQTETAHEISSPPVWSLFNVLPATPLVVHTCLTILLMQAILLLLGVASRLQAACIFVWLVSFQSRNPLIGDGEDVVFRMFALYLALMPTDYAWSLGRRIWGKPVARSVAMERAWGLRLIQIQMALIYLSAAGSKMLGSTWRDGSAMFYVYQMEDLFGRGPMPAVLLESEPLIRVVTWAVLIVEATLPLALWYRPTRLAAVCVGIALHLSMEYAMHLFLFQWIMIVGLLSFLELPFSNVEDPPADACDPGPDTVAMG